MVKKQVLKSKTEKQKKKSCLQMETIIVIIKDKTEYQVKK